VEFVASGHGGLALNGKQHELQPGTVFTYGPGISQHIRTSSERRLGKYFVDFSGSRASLLLRKHRLAPGTVTTLRHLTEVRQAFDALIRLGSSHDRHTESATALQLELLLIVIVRAAQPTTPSERQALASFERCRSHLESHFLSLRTVEEIAAACHLDVSYLSRLFRRFQGETPFRCLQRLQMQWAAERLRYVQPPRAPGGGRTRDRPVSVFTHLQACPWRLTLNLPAHAIGRARKEARHEHRCVLTSAFNSALAQNLTGQKTPRSQTG
jgi:AraC-like DNA-binding protein